MALGTYTQIDGKSFALEILESRTTTNGAPSGDAGVDLAVLRGRFGTRIPDGLSVLVKSTAGSGTMTVTPKLWLRFGTTIGWFVAGALNGGSAIAETGSDSIAYSEIVDDLDNADRAYLEISAIAGTGTSVAGYITGRA